MFLSVYLFLVPGFWAQDRRPGPAGGSTPGFLPPGQSGTLPSVSVCFSSVFSSSLSVLLWASIRLRRFLGRMAVGISAGWPLVSRRFAVWTLAAWRDLILHARLGLRLSSVEWSAIHRVPAPHLFPAPSGALCALTPRGCDRLLGGLSQCFLSTSGTGLRARRLAAQMRCAVAGCSVRSVKIVTPQASLK